MKLRKLNHTEVEFSFKLLPEDVHPRDCFATGDDARDEEIVKEILEELEYNEYAWTCVQVTARWEGFEASDFLGGVCFLYKYGGSPEVQFKTGLYEEMQHEALHQLQAELESAALVLEKLRA